MTNSYDVDHGLSQCPPGPLEPVEVAQLGDTLARTGNTARDQEMYAAGIRTGEENTKHNAAIRAGIPSGWKLVPIEPTREMLDAYVSTNSRFQSGRSDWAAMLAAAPAALGVSTVEDERQAFEAWAKRKKMPLARIGQQYDDFWVDHAWNGWQARAALDAPAAGDAREVDPLQGAANWLVQAHSQPCPTVLSACLMIGYNRAQRLYDAAIAAQRKGDA